MATARMLTLALLLAATGSAPGGEGPPSDVAALMERLGSDRYAEREAADEALRDLPRTALPEALKDLAAGASALKPWSELAGQ